MLQHGYLQNFEDLVSFSSFASSQNLLLLCKTGLSLTVKQNLSNHIAKN